MGPTLEAPAPKLAVPGIAITYFPRPHGETDHIDVGGHDRGGIPFAIRRSARGPEGVSSADA